MSQYATEASAKQVAPGVFQGHVHPNWNIGDAPNGGYLASIALDALSQSLPHPDPLSTTIHYLSPGVPDAPCDITVEVIRQGRRIATAKAQLVQEGKVRCELLTAHGDLSQSSGDKSRITIPQPQMPPPEECVHRPGDIQGIDLPIATRVDTLLHPDHITPNPDNAPEIAGWIRLADGSPPSARSLLVFADAFPPSLLPKLGRVGWVPTIELTVHVRRRPAPGWVMAWLQTDDLEGGYMIESATLWDSTGAVVAQSRQLGLVMRNE